MLTMLPSSFASIIRFAAARETSQAPLTLVSMTLSQPSGSTSRAVPGTVMPELLTTIVAGPRLFGDLGDGPLDALRVGHVHGHRHGLATRTRDRRHVGLELLPAAGGQRHLGPGTASVRAKCRPSPPEAPVTSATLPPRSKMVLMASSPLSPPDAEH